MKNIKWIFFDIGSTLVDESEAYDHRAREMLKDSGISFARFDEARISFAKQGLDGNSAAIEHFGLKKTPWHSEDEFLYPDTYATLSALRQRGYRLGIIANQNSGLEERLRAFGIYQFFDIIVSSSDVGYAKPDRGIFKLALERADCTAGESVMAGDRLDNDIIPAHRIGMKTVWIKNGLAEYQPSFLGEGVSNYQIDSLSELLKIF